ncbi:MAG: hypothetical protein ABL926_08535 [Novosphingobium sp.]|uniref:hypothetical protein n=1 Tax=Novosphingobium sp. TaxID=1874826 RepID=UPI0032B7A6F9
MRRLLILLPALLLSACGKADNEPGPGGVTVGEARALDEAAQMIEDQRLSPAATPAPAPAPPANEAKAKPPS